MSNVESSRDIIMCFGRQGYYYSLFTLTVIHLHLGDTNSGVRCALSAIPQNHGAVGRHISLTYKRHKLWCRRHTLCYEQHEHRVWEEYSDAQCNLLASIRRQTEGEQAQHVQPHTWKYDVQNVVKNATMNDERYTDVRVYLITDGVNNLKMGERFRKKPSKTKNICMTCVQCWTNVEDALYICYTNFLCSLGTILFYLCATWEDTTLVQSERCEPLGEYLIFSGYVLCKE